MKVYVVYESDWEYQNNVAVLTDEAKAKEMCERIPSLGYEEKELDHDPYAMPADPDMVLYALWIGGWDDDLRCNPVDGIPSASSYLMWGKDCGDVMRRGWNGAVDHCMKFRSEGVREQVRAKLREKYGEPPCQ